MSVSNSLRLACAAERRDKHCEATGGHFWGEWGEWKERAYRANKKAGLPEKKYLIRFRACKCGARDSEVA